MEHDYVYLQVFPYPDLLMKVEKYYQSFRWLAIRRRENIFDIDIPSTKNPGQMMKARVIRWDIAPSLKRYRDEVLKPEIEEEMARKVV